MYSASKISWFTKVLGRSKSKSKKSEADDQLIARASPPTVARKGYIAMYVGEEAKRYEVPIKYLSLPTFKELLMKSQEDDHYLDSKIDGPIMISCTIEKFDRMSKDAKHLLR